MKFLEIQIIANCAIIFLSVKLRIISRLLISTKLHKDFDSPGGKTIVCDRSCVQISPLTKDFVKMKYISVMFSKI